MYTWEFNGPDDELAAMLLPQAAQKALIALLDAMAFNPHDYGRTLDEPVGKAGRKLPFGGNGLVTVNIMDRDRLVVVVQVAWFG